MSEDNNFSCRSSTTGNVSLALKQLNHCLIKRLQDGQSSTPAGVFTRYLRILSKNFESGLNAVFVGCNVSVVASRLLCQAFRFRQHLFERLLNFNFLSLTSSGGPLRRGRESMSLFEDFVKGLREVFPNFRSLAAGSGRGSFCYTLLVCGCVLGGLLVGGSVSRRHGCFRPALTPTPLPLAGEGL